MSKSECKLQMLDLYFSKYDFVQKRAQENTDYSTSFEIEYAVNCKDSSKVKVNINTSIRNKNETVMLNLQTVGIFRIDDSDIDEEVSEQLIKINTVAIMFPFIRSQISLLTTQPGLKPIMLPPMNINALIDSQEPNSDTQ